MNIVKRKSSKGKTSYQVRVRMAGKNLTKTYTTRKEAISWGTQTEAKLMSGEYISVTKSHSLTYILKCYMKNATGNLTDNSVSTYQTVVNWVEQYFGETRIDRIGFEEFMQYFKWRGLSIIPSGVGQEQIILFMMLKKCETLPLVDNQRIVLQSRLADCVKEGLKVEGVSKPPVSRVRRVAYFEWAIIMGATAGHKRFEASLALFKLCVEFAIETCMRVSEIAALKRCDVDCKNLTIRIRKSKTDKHQKIKGRVIPMSSRARELIMMLPSRLDGLLFGYKNGKAITGKWNTLCKKEGLVDLHFHDFRHEGISQLFDLGWQPQQVAAVSGHKDWKSLAIYTHLDVSKLTDMMCAAPAAKMQCR